MKNRKELMTADEAQENIAMMQEHTQPAAMRRLVELALGPHGNLSEGAKTIYRSVL